MKMAKAKISKEEALRRIDKVIERTHLIIQEELAKPFEQRQEEFMERMKKDQNKGWPKGTSPDNLEIA